MTLTTVSTTVLYCDASNCPPIGDNKSDVVACIAPDWPTQTGYRTSIQSDSKPLHYTQTWRTTTFTYSSTHSLSRLHRHFIHELAQPTYMCGKTTPRWTTGTLVQVASERYVLGAVQQRRATDGNVLQGMLAHLWIRQMKFNLYLAIDYCIFGNIVTSCSFRTFCCFRGYVLFNKAPLERLSKIVVGLVNKKLSFCRYS